MKMRGRRSTSIAKVTPKAEDTVKDIVNSFLKYRTIDPNSAAEDCFDGLLHAIM
jgi:hypothetical protein